MSFLKKMRASLRSEDIKSVKVFRHFEKISNSSRQAQNQKKPTIFEQMIKQRTQGETISHTTGKKNLNIF